MIQTSHSGADVGASACNADRLVAAAPFLASVGSLGGLGLGQRGVARRDASGSCATI